jgi:hypothetical protein
MIRPSELPLGLPAAAEAVLGTALRADTLAGQDAVPGLSERMLKKLTQLARFELIAGQPLFRASKPHA